MKKFVLGILIAIPVVLGAILLYLYLNLNSLVVEAVETFAPRVTGTKVSLASSNISLFSGEGSLNGLVVMNPKGFQSPSAIELGSLAVVLDKDSLTTDTVVVKSIDVAEPAITFEPGGKAGSNLQQLIKNVQARGKQGKADTKPEKKDGEAAKVIIDRITITRGKVNLHVTTPLSDKPMAAELPKIELTGIGRDKGGVSAEQAISMVLEEILASASKIGAGSLDEVKDKLKTEARKRVDELRRKAGAAALKNREDRADSFGDKVHGIVK